MKALVIYESMFGNTKVVGERIADGLRETHEVDCFEVGDAPTDLSGYGLLVLGGPTHQFGMSRPDSRRQAVDYTDQPIISDRIGMREWLQRVQLSKGMPAATFDTKISKPPLPGAAGRGARKRLLRRGFRMVADSKTFYVESATGPLRDGEEDRAGAWGRSLAARVPAPAPR